MLTQLYGSSASLRLSARAGGRAGEGCGRGAAPRALSRRSRSKYEGRLDFVAFPNAKLWIKHPEFCISHTTIALNKSKGTYKERKSRCNCHGEPFCRTCVTNFWTVIWKEKKKKKREEKSSGVILNPPRYMRCPWCMCNYSIITEIITVLGKINNFIS